MKQRARSAPIGNVGVTAVRDYCDRHALIFQAEPREDFGIDCYIEVELASFPQNFLIGLQVKSGPSHRYDRQDGTFSVHIRPDDAQYWLAANYPVLLVYFHDAEGALYFQHVQAAFNDAQSLSDCRSLVFSKNDLADDAKMADYVRGLVHTTPSILSRFRVLSNPIILAIGTARTVLEQPAHPIEDILSFERFRVSDPASLRHLFAIYPRVLGYSKDERWVCEARIPDGGPRGDFDVEFGFVDLDEHASVDVRLITADEMSNAFRPQSTFDWEQYGRQIDQLNSLAKLLHIQPARVLHDEYGAMYEPQSRQPFGVSFGGEEEFTLVIGAHEGRDTLMLSASRYKPPRTAHLLAERAPFAPLFINSELFPRDINDLMRITRSPRFEFVAGAAVSQRGGLVSFAVMTVDTHDAWGTRTVHLVHVSAAELRRICAESLRL